MIGFDQDQVFHRRTRVACAGNWRPAVRTFSCLTHDRTGAAPVVSLILAADETRAQFIARRELMARGDVAKLEMREYGKVLWTALA